MISIHKWYAPICRKYQRIHRKATMANKFNSVAGYKNSFRVQNKLCFSISEINNLKWQLRKQFHLK